MIKAAIGKMAILGLEAMNLLKLKQGLPIRINLKEIGLEEVIVFMIFQKESFIAESKTKDNKKAVVFSFDSVALDTIKSGKAVITELKSLNLPDINVVILYGNTKEDIVVVIEKDLGLKIPSITPQDGKVH